MQISQHRVPPRTAGPRFFHAILVPEGSLISLDSPAPPIGSNAHVNAFYVNLPNLAHVERLGFIAIEEFFD
jgi:hypothetical protein